MNFFQLSASARLQNDFLSTRGTATVQRIAQVIPAKEQSLPDGVVPDSIQRPLGVSLGRYGGKTLMKIQIAILLSIGLMSCAPIQQQTIVSIYTTIDAPGTQTVIQSARELRAPRRLQREQESKS
jgi:hypothetical protein